MITSSLSLTDSAGTFFVWVVLAGKFHVIPRESLRFFQPPLDRIRHCYPRGKEVRFCYFGVVVGLYVFSFTPHSLLFVK